MVVLIDTSIWIDHIRRTEPALTRLLESESVVMHPFVLGEIALGTVANLQQLLWELGKLPRTKTATADEALRFISLRKLSGSGVGYVDTHLLLAAALTPQARFWTRDKKLRIVAERLGVAATGLD